MAPLAVRSITVGMCHGSQTQSPLKKDAQNPCRLQLELPHWIALSVETRSADDLAVLRRQVEAGLLQLLVGDESELERFAVSHVYANLVQFEFDLQHKQMSVVGSLVGLPPIFMFRSERLSALSSPFPPDRALNLAYGPADLEAAADILRWGHPIDGRTLAGSLRLAPARTHIVMTAERPEFAVQSVAATSPPNLSSLSVDELIAAQIRAFMDSAARLNTSDAFVSLSGGLDSRATAIALLRTGRKIPCVTLAAQTNSLDARLAHALCEAYGAEHLIVTTGDHFRRGLAARVVNASRLTMGVAALQQSIDLFLYEHLAGRFARRVSGNLGNQVGRGGIESLTVAQPAAEILSEASRTALASRPLQPWFIERMNTLGFAKVLFEQEVNFWSTANYVAGSQHGLQQMVYADRHLMALSAELYSRLAELRQITRETLRRRDLRHRIAGAPSEHSFQRRFMVEHDRLGRNVAVNWGWLARGGWSLPWLAEASRTAADLGAGMFESRSGALGAMAKLVPKSFRRPFSLVSWRTLVRHDLRELAYDATASQAARDSGIFDSAGLRRALDDHFNGARNLHGTVTAALEISLGCVSLRQ